MIINDKVDYTRYYFNDDLVPFETRTETFTFTNPLTQLRDKEFSNYFYGGIKNIKIC